MTLPVSVVLGLFIFSLLGLIFAVYLESKK